MHLPNMNKPQASQNQSQLQSMAQVLKTTFACLLALLIYHALLVVLPNPSVRSNQIGNIRTTTTAQEALDKERCEYPFIYNKPFKTASTLVLHTINDWAKTVNRPVFECGEWSHVNAVRLFECIPPGVHHCGILNNHMLLDRVTLSIVAERLPNYRYITTTRYPPHRIISEFMQINDKKWSLGMDVDYEFRDYMRNKYNQYGHIGWYTDEWIHEGHSCPITNGQHRFIYQMASKFAIVIDANLIEESNVILRHANLFTLPEDGKRSNFRGSQNVNISNETVSVMKKVLCFELALHEALQFRMASLYEQATGKPCVREGQMGKASNCIKDKEREILNDDWIF